MTTAIVCVALLALLVFGLGFFVSITRGKTNTLIGCEENPEDATFKAVRAHGNATEYVPILAILILYLGSTSPAVWVVWIMIIVTFARYLQAMGLLLPATMAKPNPMRLIGSMLTYLGGLALVVATFLSIG
jgi:uncharacterized membrane protein YecN with MAPEG domain